MKFIAVAITGALAGLASAQDGLPSCAQPCVNQYISTGIGDCSKLDIRCICSNKSFLSGIACCLQANCNAADQANAVTFATNLCRANQVTDLPTAVSGLCTSTSSIIGPSITSPVTSATTAPAGTNTTAGPNATAGLKTIASSSPTVASTTRTGSTTIASSASSAAAAAATRTCAAGLGIGIAGGIAAVAALL